MIIQRKSLFLCALLLLFATARAEITEQQIEADCAKIPVLASQGEQLYKTQKYAKALDAFEQLAAWSESCALDDNAIATAYNNVALTWIREGEWRKARAWLMLRPNDSKSIYNLKLIKDKLSVLPPPVSTAGEYWRYAGRASWNVL
ncbi:TPA: tetratricopeptide repeat protein, partial [Salmonella enterica subsp. enterica serovar Typhi str. AG3]|nr:tetratricopeptide repeat protein [Salmonella enterica subsp. enterica serovar Typhi str. AG3]